MKRVMTVDLEYDFETNSVESLKLLPKLLDFFDDNGVRATFFVLGSLAERYPDVVDMIKDKHEIAGHGYSHKRLNLLTDKELQFEVQKTKKILGKKCVGFRAPYYMFDNRLFSLLKKNGYEYDSSLSTFFPGRYFHPFAKTKPHVHDGINELPVPNFIPKLLPAGLSYYRLMFPFSRILKIPYMLYLHPCEFLKKGMSKNIGFFVRQIYGVNRGAKAWDIFEEVVRNSNCKWVGCKEYLDSKPISK